MHKTITDAQTHMHKQRECRIDTHKASGLFTSRLIKMAITIYALHFYAQYFKYAISTVLSRKYCKN